MSEDLSHWLFKERYTIDEVALLIAGIDPVYVDHKVSNALKERVQGASRASVYLDLLGKETEDGGPIPREHAFARPDVKDPSPLEISSYWSYWWISKASALDFALRYKLPFPNGCIEHLNPQSKISTPIEHLLTPQHEFYSDDLAVAIEAWKELAQKGLGEDKTFMDAAKRVIKRLRPTISKTNLLRIARVLNCKPGTTQERTPYQTLEKA
ncbi:hypothetical protein [Endozoicomonas sp. YOMI1]|uniref:hypothetical protein n=1 Tax=Endozoicomonas sp. YOMI1 TaxID=2828739 RepID=UPI0021474111|nr:hypothetical protein [Endozoicomonas sp. YOMI1]